jgi:GrpB-like predicted nucleotidyltransferase (UPF0157 family)
MAASVRRPQSRIRRALGDGAVRVEHIGSRSVPEPAKPIIDILVMVRDITAEEDYLERRLAAHAETEVIEAIKRRARERT